MNALNLNMLINKVFRKIKRTFSRLIYTRRKVEKLKLHADIVIQNMAKAIDDSLNGSLSQEQKSIVNRVENIRADYKSRDIRLNANNRGESTEKDDISYLMTVASKRKEWLIFHIKLIQHFNIKKGLEFGTCVGISAAYQAEAIKLNNGEKLITMEGLESRHQFSRKLLDQLHIDNVDTKLGDFNEILPDVLKENALFDYLFLDGDHRYESTLSYFEQVLPYMKDSSIIIVDDIRWSNEMEKAWEEIRNHKRVLYSFDFELVGICITGDDKPTNHFRMSLW